MARLFLPEPTAPAIEAEQIRLLYHQGTTIQLLGIATALVAVSMLWKVTDHVMLLVWLGVHIALTLWRLQTGRRFAAEGPGMSQMKAWGRRYIAGTLLSGFVWGSLALFYDPAWPAPYQVVLFVVYTGLIGGAFNTNASYFVAFPAFYLPLVGFLMYVMLSHADEGFIPLAFLFAIYIILMYISSLKFNRRLTHALQLRFDNEKLASDLADSNAKLMRLADMDPLTQLYNRRSMDRYLSREWQRHYLGQLPLSMIFIDIDYFKQYNDTYGHHEGDLCLVDVAKSLGSVLPQGGMAARFGGEEFALILPETSADEAFAVADALRTQIRLLQIPHAGSSVSKYVTLSVGVTTMVPKDPNGSELFRLQADKALYAAKEAGRDRIVKSPFADF